MPYVIFTANGEEYDRRELTRPIVLGRAPDCDIAIPDITLSRHHCRLEPSENGRSWQLVDLHSKNGTHFLGQKVECHVFRDRDELRIGRTRLTFRAGEFVPTGKVKTRGVIRPTDPHEALAGTVTGMVLCEPGETEKYEGMPVPQPRPSDPMSFQKEDIYGMINEIASSSWDSIQAQASQPTRMQRATPVPGVTQASRTGAAAARPKPRVAFCLQAEHDKDGATTSPAVMRHSSPERAAATTTTNKLKPTRSAAPAGAKTPWKMPRPSNKLWLAMASAAVVGLLFVGWVSLLLHMTRDTGPTAPRPLPKSPAAPTEISDAAQPAAMLPPTPTAAPAN